jgi:hypothetical protein
VPIKGNSQTISLWLESEINPASIVYNNDVTGFSTAYPFLRPDSYSALDITIPNNYRCNMSSNLDNSLKIWITSDDLDRELTETKSRIIYSDQKIYNADIEGFDRFPALNYYDLDESFGGITKMLISGDNAFVIQENAYAYLPIDSNIIESADAINLSIRSGEIIGIPKYVNTTNGCQHIRTIQQHGNSFFFFDYKNKLLIKSMGGEEQVISDIGLIDLFNDIEHTIYAKRGYEANEIVSFYDSKNRIYGISKRMFEDGVYGDVPEFTYIYDDKIGGWTTRWNQEGATTVSIYGGVTSKYGDLFLIGKELGPTNPVSISTMHTGNICEFFGVSQPIYIDFIVNPVVEFPKTFDTIIINSDGPLTSLTMSVPTPDGTYTTGAMSLAINDVESLYKLKSIRNTATVNGKTGQRLRGLYSEYRIIFPTTETKLNNVITRYRPSNRGL